MSAADLGLGCGTMEALANPLSDLRMVDLYSGTGGASAVALARGWTVRRVELERSCPGARGEDVREYRESPGAIRLLWASPPCTEFSRESMPWCRTGRTPSLELWDAAHAQIARLNPRWWVVENVRGAQKWVGPATFHLGPFYLWTNIPAEAFARVPRATAFWGAYKQRLSGENRARAGRERGAIPQIIAKAVTDWAEAHP